jgi:hypothetical protein
MKKFNRGRKLLTFGEFITMAYKVCGDRNATNFVKLAIKAHLIEFRGRDRLVIS